MAWMEPKMDWLATDYYNFEDLNRVENNTGVIVGLIAIFDTPPSLVTDTERDIKAIELADNLNRIESNIDALRARYTPPGWLPNKLDWAANTPFSYVDAARLEKNLALLYFYYWGNIDSIKHCGAYTCGEEAI